jgi:hypothetical protein
VRLVGRRERSRGRGWRAVRGRISLIVGEALRPISEELTKVKARLRADMLHADLIARRCSG